MLAFSITLIAVLSYITKKYKTFALSIFALVTNGFQVVPSSTLYYGFSSDKGSDYALVACFSIILIEFKKNILLIKNDKVARAIVLFFAFLLFLCCYSYFFRDIDVIYIIRNIKFLFVFSLYFVFIRIPFPSQRNVFNFILNITFFLAGLYILQVPASIYLYGDNLGIKYSTLNQMDGLFPRFRNAPLYFIFFGLFFSEKIHKNLTSRYDLFKYLIMLLGVFFTFSRSVISVVIGLISLINIKKATHKSKIIFIVFLVSVFSLNNNSIFQRLSSLSEIGNIFTSKNIVETNEDNFSFRIAHATERLDYVSQNWYTFAFGIGLLTEDSPNAKLLNFKTGLLNEDNEVVQVDTADIVWSRLLLTTGIVGSLLYIILLWYIYKNTLTSNRLIKKSMLLYLLSAFLLSFTTVELLSVHFIALYVLLSAMLRNFYFHEINNRKLEYNTDRYLP